MASPRGEKRKLWTARPSVAAARGARGEREARAVAGEAVVAHLRRDRNRPTTAHREEVAAGRAGAARQQRDPVPTAELERRHALGARDRVRVPTRDRGEE